MQHYLCDSLELRLQAFNFRALILLLHSLVGRDPVLLNPGVRTMRRYPQTVSNAPDRKTAFDNLPNRLDLELLGKAFPTHVASFIALNVRL
jgi:hypothetical protein